MQKIKTPKQDSTVYSFLLLFFFQSLIHSRFPPSPCWGNRREGDHWGDLGVDGWIILGGVDGWIILGRISNRWDVGIWTGLGWPRLETGGGRL